MEMKNGCFYAVGVGPGDSELITVKALRVLSACPVLAVPRSGGGSPALDIVRGAMDISGKKLIDIATPMTRDKERLDAAHLAAAERIMAQLRAGNSVAMPNLGDVSVYASAMYLVKIISDAGFDTAMIPGVPSFCAAAARLNISLTEADRPLVIIPGGAASELLTAGGTRVIMKSGRQLADTLDALDALGLSASAVAVENCGMENERVFRDVRVLRGGAGYFTTIIVKEKS